MATETSPTARQLMADAIARRKRMMPRPSPKPAIIVAAAPEPKDIPAEVQPIEPVPVPAVEKERPYARWSFVVDHLHGANETSEVPLPSLTHIKTIVAKHFNVSILDMESARRTKEVVWPRQIATYLCATMTRRSLPAIGRAFGGRDHTTSLSSKRKITRLAAADNRLCEELEALKKKILEAA